jgi:hypothetical protein
MVDRIVVHAARRRRADESGLLFLVNHHIVPIFRQNIALDE